MLIAGFVCGLLQPSAPPQLDPACDGLPASQRSGHGALQSLVFGPRIGAIESNAVFTIVAFEVGEARGGLYQSAASRNQIRVGYVGDGCCTAAGSACLLAATVIGFCSNHVIMP